MVGEGEDANYALELTYNGGIYSYDAGAGVCSALCCTSMAPASRTPRGTRRGRHSTSTVSSGNVSATGTDGYNYELHDNAERGGHASEPFGDVRGRAA